MTRKIEIKDVKNPFTAQVVTAAGRQAVAQRAYDRARDEASIAHAEVSGITREIRAALTADLRVTAATERRLERARERVEGAEGSLAQAAETLRLANGELTTAQRAAGIWVERQAHQERQARADADIPPRERERRQLRARLAELESQ